MLPGIPPTGKYVELPHVVVMKFNGYKIAHEHIYWDQASLLAQVGLLYKKLTYNRCRAGKKNSGIIRVNQ